MSLFGGVVPIAGISFLMFSVFIVAAFGYLLGRITIKGVSLGTAGVFIVALLFGALFSTTISETITQKTSATTTLTEVSEADLAAADADKNVTITKNDNGTYTMKVTNPKNDISSSALKIIENMGLILFVAAVGFIAGPNFFKNLKKNFKSYIMLGLIIIVSASLACVACFYIGRGAEKDPKEFVAMLVGILSGALTSTPAFSAAKATVNPEYETAVTVGHGIAYLFGVIGVVLFVQLIPKISRANMDEERKKITVVDTGISEKKEGTFHLDGFGFCAFAIAVIIGIFVGAIKIPLSGKGLSGTTFSLTTTGGVLLTTLVFGHFGKIGNVSFKLEKRILETFREFGLMLFLIGAGIAGGAKFIEYFKPVYFVYGVVMTLVPLIIGFLFAKFVLKLPMLNNLGSITGGMTSTPALGTLINVAGTDDVASAYAATYPVALIAVVLLSQAIILIL